MIRFENVSKEYRSKKGGSTKALTDININLNNKGLIFIIGKSGSGKSTLLNILGGLDSKTSGKIYIDNKDIDSFKEKDFDSYRNTYIGFIFQDFNLLEEYNVFDNVMLSAKLQKKKVDKEEILNLLDRLGLKGLEYRNINELSGGQKQRVGIARALIKNPKIILADEPTGNLDSISSKETFKLLKEISKEKLVVVVSHDLENANTYADKILELQDGKAIRNDLTIKEQDNSTFTSVSAKLPFKECLHFAFTSLKSNKVKLFFTIILTMISLVFMGISVNSFLYDKGTFMAGVMRDNNEYIFDISKIEVEPAGASFPFDLTNDDLNILKENINEELNPTYRLYNNNRLLTFTYGDYVEPDEDFDHVPMWFNYIELKDDRILGNIEGKIPVNSNEIMVHKNVARYICKYGILDSTNNIYKPNSIDELINSNKEIMLGDNKVIITGIVDNDLNDDYFIYVNGFVDNAILNNDINTFLTDSYLSKKEITAKNIAIYNNNVQLITNTITKLNKDEIIISLDLFRELDNNFNDELNEYLLNNSEDNYSSLINTFTNSYINTNNSFNNLYITFNGNLNSNSIKNDLKVVGISLDNNNYVSNDYITEIESTNSNKYNFSYRVYEDNYNELKNIINTYETNYNRSGVYYYLTLPHYDDLEQINAIYNFLAKYINIITLVFVLFTILLFSNFIYISITYSKKQIGILRALGTSKNDVIKIFLYESIVVGIISYIISIILWFISINLLNNSLFGDKTYILNGIVTNPWVPVIMFVYTIIISIIITIISLSKITKIKPIDAILNK